MNLEGIPRSQQEFRRQAVAKAIADCKGVLHLGAHAGQEAADYDKAGKPVLWVEAIPQIHERLAEHIAGFKNQRAICALLGDEDGKQVSFHISNNWNGVSSSIFEFGPFAQGEQSLWPDLDLKMVDAITLEMTTLDRLLQRETVDAAFYDHWIVDVQGAELLALRGAMKSLALCRSLFVEVSQKPVYEGGVLWPELRQFLTSNGFDPLWTPQKTHDDVLFLRNR